MINSIPPQGTPHDPEGMGARGYNLCGGTPSRSGFTAHPQGISPGTLLRNLNLKKPIIKMKNLFSLHALLRIARPYSARSVKTIDPEIREILIFTLWPGFALATYMM